MATIHDSEAERILKGDRTLSHAYQAFDDRDQAEAYVRGASDALALMFGGDWKAEVEEAIGLQPSPPGIRSRAGFQTREAIVAYMDPTIPIAKVNEIELDALHEEALAMDKQRLDSQS